MGVAAARLLNGEIARAAQGMIGDLGFPGVHVVSEIGMRQLLGPAAHLHFTRSHVQIQAQTLDAFPVELAGLVAGRTAVDFDHAAGQAQNSQHHGPASA